MEFKIPVIDLFAGPGGLGEGFMALKNEAGTSVFDIKLSIEKEENAHKTLTLRSFFRQFTKEGREVPNEYYEILQLEDLQEREKRIEELLDKYPEGKLAKEEARLIELGSPNWPENEIDNIIHSKLKGEKNWVLIGGPPCQAYSIAGRARGISKEDHRVFLYKEYLRIIEVHKPAIYIMENVKGLLSAKIEDEKIFDWMKKDLELNGEYEIHSLVKPVENDKDYLIKSEDFGIPQRRHRVILFGIRKNKKHKGLYLQKKPIANLKTVINDLPEIRSGLNRKFIGYSKTEVFKNGRPKRNYENLKDSDKLWEETFRLHLNEIKKWGDLKLNGLSKGPKKFEKGTGGEFVKKTNKKFLNKLLKDWYLDNRQKGFTNHDSRGHLTQDLLRYLFGAIFTENHKTFPRVPDFARHNEALLPEHSNINSGSFVDRFRVQEPNRPASTITSHISKDGHSFIHYDPAQCRSFTVREAARVQTFPDNYLFRGSRTAQYQQVGNAVPPYLAYQIAQIVFKTLI